MTRAPRVVAVILAAMTVCLLPSVALADFPSTIDPRYGVIEGMVHREGTTLGFNGRVTAENVVEGWTYHDDMHEDPYKFQLIVEPGTYRILFEDGTSSWSGETAWEYYPNSSTRSGARLVTVKAGQLVTGVNETLDDAGHISGTVSIPTDGFSNRPPRIVPYYREGASWRRVPFWSYDQVVPVYSEQSTEPRNVRPYSIGGLRPGTYKLRYETTEGHGGSISGFLGNTDDVDASTSVEVNARETTVADFSPRQGGRIVGRVLDRRGAPVKDLYVGAIPVDKNDEGHLGRGARTDDDGNYEIFPLDRDEYILRMGPIYSGGVVHDYIEPDASRDAATRISATPGMTTTWRDEVQPDRGTLEGTVTDWAEGRPIEGAVVELRVYSGVTARNLTQTTDAAGHYDFGPLDHLPGRLTVLTDRYDAFSNESYDNGRVKGTRPGSWFLLTSEIFVPVPDETSVVDFDPYLYPAHVNDETPVVGQELIASAPGGPSEGDIWEWRRSGVVIPGAVGPRYRTATTDRGARLTAQLTTDRPGRPFLPRSPATAGVSTSRPTLRIAASSNVRGKVVLTIKASAASIPASLLDGRIEIGRVRPGSDHVATTTMRDGSLSVTLTGQPAGKHTYTAQFLPVADRYSASAVASRYLAVR